MRLLAWLCSTIVSLTMAAGCASDAPPSDASVVNLCEMDGGVELDEDGGINTTRPAPPEHCLAPCIWELIAPCNPRMCCIQLGSAAGCYLDGSFRWTSTYESSSYTWSTTVYRADGSVCYSVVADGSSSTFKDGAGKLVALVSGDRSYMVTSCADGRSQTGALTNDCPDVPPAGCESVASLPDNCR